ncbi:MerR family transcriptional regulator [Clavibacter michiganensis subsp. phaseoli]|uniref:transcriptional regulator FtsR n=1 Tax=Clavibacter phaseoli TaxID=1734031 RepID=UPI001FB3C169|nr:MerR family transcriptional regulator [Clavibacter phaseoli]MCJ1711382.1 MerR family transcriptional regulator [Clavibacter phaseoli]
MPASAARSTPARTPGLLSIGQVLARLTPEFPDLTNSKLRFLEEQGLVQPSRTESGYRKFSPADVERLRTVLGMQRDHYLPLKVIRSYLHDLDAGLSPALPGGTPVPQASMLDQERRYSRAELVRESGATAPLLGDAITAGVLMPAEVYGEDAVQVMRALVELQRTGIEPRHLRGFRQAAERELSLIESALVPVSRRRDASSRAQAAELAREIATQLEVVRGSLIRSALGRLSS